MTPFRLRLAGGVAALALVVAGVSWWQFGRSAASSEIFDSDDVLRVRLEAPFNDLFAHAYDEQEYTVKGTLMRDGWFGKQSIADVKISIRGNSSKYLIECTFPKLKLRLADNGNSAPLPFTGVKSIKIGTHCGERPDGDLSPELGRWGNEKAPHREALVYHLLDAMGLPTLKARPARIEYVYDDPQANRTPDQHHPIERNAIFLEDDDDARVRLGAEANLKDFVDARTHFTAEDALNLAFGEAMIGNFDWCLKFSADDPYHCDDDNVIYNVLAFRRGDGTAVPVMYDFDLSGMVTGRHRWFESRFDRGFVASRSEVEVEAISQVQRLRALFSHVELDAARARFKQYKPEAYRAVDRATVDSQGRTIARSYLDAFFAAIDSDSDFYRTVLTRGGEYAYSDAAGAAAICVEQGPLPVGTPISDPRASSGEMIQIHLLDVVGELAKGCASLRNGPVWVHQASVGANFP